MPNETSMASSINQVLLNQSNDLIWDFQSNSLKMFPINDCPRYCTKSNWTSLDTNDFTGDHERFE